MKLVIKDPVPNTKTPNSYEVVIETMSGDGDGYEDIIVGPFIKDKDEAVMENLFTLLDQMDKAFPHGMGGRDDFDHVGNFAVWFGGNSLLSEEKLNSYYPKYPYSYQEYVEINNLIGNFATDWVHDPMTDYQSPNSYVGFKVFYYDDNKVQHVVELMK
jgi:hypothetical protein